MSTLPKRLQLRRDTAANWVLANPVLLAGEFAYETDSKKNKIGDGIRRWNDLGYHNSAASAGPTGPTGPSGSSNGALTFDGGGPANSFVKGPVLDCGGVF